MDSQDDGVTVDLSDATLDRLAAIVEEVANELSRGVDNAAAWALAGTMLTQRRVDPAVLQVVRDQVWQRRRAILQERKRR
jgi:hypothetical protein